MLYKFDEFSEGLILESALNESTLVYSINLKSILYNLRNSKDEFISDIAHKISFAEGSVIKDDITMIDMDFNSDGSLVTFTTSKNIKNEFPEIWSRFFHNDDKPESQNAQEIMKKRERSYAMDQSPFKKQNRNSIKFGKFIKKVIPNISDADLEKFLNEFKSITSSQEFTFDILQGKDIIKGYTSENCEDGGTLTNSCMKDKTQLNSDIFKLYTENPESVKLLILKKADKIVARALVWQCESVDGTWEEYSNVSGIKSGTKFTLLDRVYFSKDFYENKMFSYADKQGWCRRINSQQCIDSSGKTIPLKAKVQVRKLNYPAVPYLDTFALYYYKESILTNRELSDNKGQKRRDYAELTSTRGEMHYHTGGIEELKGKALNFIRKFGEF